MLGGGWGVSRSAPPSLEAMCACSGAQLGHLERVVDAELSESARRDTFLEEEAVDLLRSEASGSWTVPSSTSSNKRSRPWRC